MGNEVGGIRFIKKWVRTAFIAAAIAIAVLTVTSAQTSEPVIESASTADEAATGDAIRTPDGQSTEANVSTAIEPTAKPTISDAVEVDIQRRFNELRGELLDDRAAYIDRWLIAVSIVLAFFAFVAVLGGYMGFRRFREIETEAKNSVSKSRETQKKPLRYGEVSPMLLKKSIGNSPPDLTFPSVIFFHRKSPKMRLPHTTRCSA